LDNLSNISALDSNNIIEEKAITSSEGGSIKLTNSNNNNDSENSNFNYNSNTNEYKNNNKVMLITELIKNEFSKFNRDDTNKIQISMPLFYIFIRIPTTYFNYKSNKQLNL